MPDKPAGKPAPKSTLKPNVKPQSVAAQALGWIDPETGAVVPPIYTSTTFERDPDNEYRAGPIYGRPDNPTYRQAEAVLSALEGGEQSLLFASGMAAATAVFQALAPGDHVVAPRIMYHALRKWLLGLASEWGLSVDLVAMDDVEAVREAVRPGKTKLVWVETPANPLWTVTDIVAVVDIAHKAGAVVAADSTVASPVHCQPLSLGADIVMHAATKYLNGHSDVIAGSLTTARADDFWDRITTVRHQIGGVLGPFEASQLLRGMRTLFVRVRESSRSAQQLAEALDGHQAISTVLYPGLPGDPGHEVAARQMRDGFGSMLSIRVRGGEAAAIAAAAKAELWKRATSLGGVESLIEHRASMEGEGSPTPSDLLRLSVGIEDADDLLADLKQALAGL